MITQYSNTQLRNTQYRDLLPTVFSLGKPYFWGMASQVEKDALNYVSKMIDMSGNGNDVIQGTQTNKPLWVDDELNGHPVLTFSGNQRLYKALSIHPPYTIMVVWKETNGYTNPNVVVSGNTNSEMYTGCYMYIQPGYIYAAAPVQIYYFRNHGDYYQNTFTFGIRYGMYENSIKMTGNNPGTNSITGLYIGGQTYSLSGNLAEVIIYNKALTDIDRQKVETYLMNKYGL
jgi:hypothetical protein